MKQRAKVEKFDYIACGCDSVSQDSLLKDVLSLEAMKFRGAASASGCGFLNDGP